MLTVKVVTDDRIGLTSLKLGSLTNAMQKQVAYATMRALNAAAYEAAQETKRELARVFNRPTPWVLGSVRYTKAKKDRLEASVDFDYWGNKQQVTVAQVLKAEIEGGRRRLKRFEVALQRVGVLPAGMAAVPGPAAKLDGYGNMNTGQITQILSWFRAFGEQGYRANMRDGGRRLANGNRKTGARGYAYFALARKHGKLLPGVYQRFDFGAIGSSVKPVLFFVPIPSYRRALDFYGVAERAARAEFNRQFPIMMDEAMRTAR